MGYPTAHGSAQRTVERSGRLTDNSYMLIRTFEDSHAWQAAHQFTLEVYRESSSFPSEEIYGLTRQLRRAASSVAANLAEGYGRRSKRELMRFTVISNGSLQEAKYFLILARDGHLTSDFRPWYSLRRSSYTRRAHGGHSATGKTLVSG